MNKYERLLEEAKNEGLYIIEQANFESDSAGLINGDVIGLNRNLESTSEKACVLAEELGHHYTTVGNIMDLSDAQNRKQERQARLHGYNKMVGLYGIISAYRKGCHSLYEAADYLEVAPEYLQECLDCYKDKYGVCTTVDNYIIYFIPNLAVMEKI